MNDNSRLARESANQPLQVTAGERDTAGSWSQTRPRDMDEYRTAASCDAWPGVVVHFHDQIIKAVGAPETVAWVIGRPPERAVVTTVLGVFAPSVLGGDTPDG
jgi:hypothetical protein